MNLHSSGLLAVLALLSGCGVYESLGGIPNAKRKFELPTNVTAGKVFECAKRSIDAVPEPSNWNKAITKKDLDGGVMEVGKFDEPNVVGFRAKISVDEEKGSVSIAVKGAGPYYRDLGVDSSAEQLAGDTKQCIGIQ